jgi:Flp pilus assembly protein TadG
MAVEMALVGTAFVTLLFASIEVGRYFFVNESIKYVVGELARAAIVDPLAVRSWSDAQKSSFVQSKSGLLHYADFSPLTITIVKQEAPTPTTIRVRAVYPYAFRLGLLSAYNTSIENDVRFTVVVP